MSGVEVVRQLVEGGCKDVHVLDNLASGAHRLSQIPLDKVTVHVCDLTDRHAVEKVTKAVRPTCVVHLAAIHFIPACEADPGWAAAVNVTGTVNMLKATPAGATFVLASTAAVYAPEDIAHEERRSATRPMDIYGLTKLHGEDYVAHFHRTGALNGVIVRLFNVVGPGETNPHLAPAIIRQLTDGNRQVGLGNLFPKRDYLHVFDAAEGVLRLSRMPRGDAPTICNLGSGQAHSVEAMVRAIGAAAGVDLDIRQDPTRVRAVDRPMLLASTDRLQELTGWRPTRTLEISMSDAWGSRDADRLAWTASVPRVLGVALTPPVYKASGGVSAGMQLMRAVAAHAEVIMAVMADRTEQVVEEGLSIRHQVAVNRLGPFHRMVPMPAATLMWRPSLDRMLAEYRPDIVHLHNPHPPGALMAAAMACLLHGVPYVVSTHGFVEYHDAAAGYGMAAWKRPLMRSLVRRPLEFVSRNAAAVCMLSPEEEAILLDLGADRARLRVVTNGVDPYFLESVPEATRRALVARFDLPERVPIALFVGNHTANKGLDVLLEAMHRVQAPLTAVIAGAIRSRSEHDALRQAHRVQALGGRVIFTDFLSRRGVARPLPVGIPVRIPLESRHPAALDPGGHGFPAARGVDQGGRHPVRGGAGHRPAHGAQRPGGVRVRPGRTRRRSRTPPRPWGSPDATRSNASSGGRRRPSTPWRSTQRCSAASLDAFGCFAAAQNGGQDATGAGCNRSDASRQGSTLNVRPAREALHHRGGKDRLQAVRL